MKILCSVFLWAILAVGGFGQSSKYPNELHNLKLIDQARLRDLNVGVTLQEAVEAAFDKGCESDYCELDETWLVKFYFFSKGERSLPRDPKFPRSVPIAKFDGRLRAIILKPRNSISLNPSSFSRHFRRGKSVLVEGAPAHGKSKLMEYEDRYGLRYTILAKASHLGKKYDLLEISYGLPATAEATAFEVL